MINRLVNILLYCSLTILFTIIYLQALHYSQCSAYLLTYVSNYNKNEESC